MSEDARFDRRQFLRTCGVVATVTVAAGCTDTGGEGQEPADGGSDTGGGTNETDGNETTTGDGGANETVDNESESNQSGNQPAGGGDVVEVIAGPDGEFVFEPEQLSIDAGTTVRWVWESDTHNVVPRSQPQGANWQGHETIEDTGFEYEHTFETTGTYEYVCVPHEARGMTGTITVE